MKDRSDELPLVLFKLNEEALLRAFACLSRSESLIVPIFKKVPRNDLGNHRGIGLIALVIKFLAPTVLRRLAPVHDNNVPEQQA